jgi:hypothetical protein
MFGKVIWILAVVAVTWLLILTIFAPQAKPQEKNAIAVVTARIIAASRAGSRAIHNRVVNAIDTYLAGTPMEGLGECIATNAERTSVNPFLCPAVAMAESTCGRQCFSPHNAWGMIYERAGFPSWEAGVERWFDFVLSYFGPVQDAWSMPGYCVPSDPWRGHVQGQVEYLEVL